jgi:hypothetical protein
MQPRAAASHVAPADSNSPAYWAEGQLKILNSDGTPRLSGGADQFNLSGGVPVAVDRADHQPMWIEAAWMDADGILYGWYHHEPSGVCAGDELTAPQIGALISYDGGKTFQDLGIVLASGDAPDCGAKNGFFAGGHGDFSVIPDLDLGYFYFLFTNYGGGLSGQGVAIARMAFNDRQSPAGAVYKYFGGEWNEPGVGGRVTSIFPARVSWQRADTDSFWGASIHWNTYLESYVVLMSHACCSPRWPQEGIYISYNPDLSDPSGWTSPERILQKPSYSSGFYPQVIGLTPGDTDKVAGQVARLWVHGRSNWEIVFSRTDPFTVEEPVEMQSP